MKAGTFLLLYLLTSLNDTFSVTACDNCIVKASNRYGSIKSLVLLFLSIILVFQFKYSELVKK